MQSVLVGRIIDTRSFFIASLLQYLCERQSSVYLVSLINVLCESDTDSDSDEESDTDSFVQ